MGPYEDYEVSAEELMSDEEAEDLANYDEGGYGDVEYEDGYEFADWIDGEPN